MAKLRKRPGTEADQGLYEVSGSLDGITGPGRRQVKELELRELDGADLSPLAAFEGLESLRIERSRRIDLSTLPALPGLRLLLDRVSELDLAPFDDRDDLTGLWLLDPGECRVPERLRLSSRLDALYVSVEGGGANATSLHELIEAVDWPRLTQLRSLDVRASLDAPLGIDLGFLKHLPALERLRVRGDLRHAGAAPSPLDPPFEGLSTRLTQVEFKAYDAGHVRAELQRYLGVPDDPTAGPAITERYGWEPGRPMWTMVETGLGWETFGSFAIGLGDPSSSEGEARSEARRRLAKQDKALAKRLELDALPPGSAATAMTRGDLEAMLAALSLRTGGSVAPSGPVKRLMPGEQYGREPVAAGWEIRESRHGGWSVYGSFYELFDERVGDGEHEAMREAQKRVRRRDGGLERRLEFDPESDGTGVYAERREDLEAMLQILDAPR